MQKNKSMRHIAMRNHVAITEQLKYRRQCYGRTRISKEGNPNKLNAVYYFVLLSFAPSIDLVCGIAKINFAHCKNEQNHDGRKKRPLPIGRRQKPEILPNKMASQFVRLSITDKKWSKRSQIREGFFLFKLLYRKHLSKFGNYVSFFFL